MDPEIAEEDILKAIELLNSLPCKSDKIYFPELDVIIE